MKLTSNWLYLFLLILCLTSFSGCNSLSPIRKAENVRPVEVEAAKEKKKDVADKSGGAVQHSVKNTVTPLEVKPEPLPSVANDMNAKQRESDLSNVTEPTDEELIENAQDNYEAANDYFDKGDQDSALDALDKAYSYMLKVDATNNPELLQQKEDMRFAISNTIVKMDSSTRSTAVNGNHKAIPLDMNSYVQKAIEYFQTKDGKKFFLESYARSGKYRPAIIRALKDAGLPEELSWLPLIESGFKNTALSSARALGMWQFIASTGYRYGLKRDTWIDERMDAVKATAAAIGYLNDLHQMFGDWTTVLAAYNCGEKRVENEINKQPLNYLDNFWDLYQKLPDETVFYVPKFLAVLHIVHDPAAYGFELPQLEEEIQYEEVTIDKQLSLATIAKSIDVDSSILKSLNPELRRDATPKTAYDLKLPVGKREVLMANLSTIPATIYVDLPQKSSYISSTYHTVRSGDTLSTIAKKYKTTVKAIMSANGLKSQSVLKVGQKLKLSTTKKAIIAEASPSTTSDSTGVGGDVSRYTVKKGDSLYNIAKRNNTTAQSLKVLNGLSSANLSVGQELIISPGGGTASKEGSTQKYTVRKGDYPAVIAKKYNMDLYDFLKINGLTPGSTIFPGQEVQVTVE